MKQVFQAKTKDAIYEVEGTPVGKTLAVTPELVTGRKGKIVYGSKFMVTHIPTGYTVGDGLPKAVAKALARAMVTLGMDVVVADDPIRAARELRDLGVVTLLVQAQSKTSARSRIQGIERYVEDQLSRARSEKPASSEKRAAKRRRPEKRASSPPVEVDLIAMARRARGNPCSTGRSSVASTSG